MEAKYVIELSDEELRIVTESELKEFDGFTGILVRGRLVESQQPSITEEEIEEEANKYLTDDGFAAQCARNAFKDGCEWLLSKLNQEK